MTYEEQLALMASLGKIINLRPEFSTAADMTTYTIEIMKLTSMIGADVERIS